MNKKTIIIITIILIAILGGGGYYLLSGKYQTGNQPQPSTVGGEQNSTSAEAPTSTGNEEVQLITMKNFSFNPANVTIKSGTKVRWTNEDTASHDVTSDNFKSELLGKGESYEFKFDTVGTYDYICGVHPSMKGRIVVE